MPDAMYRFKVGEIECIPVSDGSFDYPPALLFANVPQDRIREELRAHDLATEQVNCTYICLLIQTGKHNVLLDTGAANFAPTTGELLQNLERAQVKAPDIDTVILTHGHPDHIAGAINAEGRPAFPNARYVMWKAEWDFWTSERLDLSAMMVPEDLKQNLIVGTARRCLPPLEQQIELLEKETDIVPGVRAVPAPGHTPGHMVVSIESGRESVFHLADAVIHPLHLEQPSWQTVFDLDQDQAARTRRQILDRAAADRMNVLAYHFPFPGLGRVISRGTPGWVWEPAD